MLSMKNCEILNSYKIDKDGAKSQNYKNLSKKLAMFCDFQTLSTNLDISEKKFIY